jgi:hypothetical protein
MTKYRIVEVNEASKTYYLLQIKKLFSWVTECDGGCDDLGTYEYPRKFKNREDAKEFYMKWYTEPKRRVIKF